METSPSILIVNMRSQFTLVIARILRENKYRSVVLSPTMAEHWMKTNTPKSIIISGSDKSVHDNDAPKVPDNIINSGIPILGICYGMQWLVHQYGGVVRDEHEQAEFGPAKIEVTDDSDLFRHVTGIQDVWANHADSVTTLPAGFEPIARDIGPTVKIARAIRNRDWKMWGVQFHPEVTHTDNGKQILLNFVEGICKCVQDWKPENIVNSIQQEIAENDSIRAILGFSGGVDSTTMARILSPVLKKRLHGVCIDGGQFREGELEEIRQNAKSAGITLEIIDVKDECLEALKGITDAEEIRRIFKGIYVRHLKMAAIRFGATHIVEGTLATDLIESGATGAHKIKSHHNEGNDWGNLISLCPIATFFKYEVRALAKSLYLPKSVSDREPFPGPGLFVRIFGGDITRDRLEIVKWADHKTRTIFRETQGTPDISQPVIGLCCAPTTGNKGEGRAYGPSIVIHAIQTIDYMTANAVKIPEQTRDVVTEVLTKHKKIVRVWWDETPKPPATIEFM